MAFSRHLLPLIFAVFYTTHAIADTICGPDNQKWVKEGHGHLVSIAATYAGFDPSTAKQLALYTQAPDSEGLSFSAPADAVWGVFRPWYRNRVMNVLHSLHGGDHQQVLARRKNLAALVHRYVQAPDQPVWKVGFLLHALGDSYAHTYLEDGQLKAYGSVIGHGFHHEDDADNMALHYDKYRESALVTFDALNYRNLPSTQFVKFIAKLDKLDKAGASRDKFEAAVRKEDKTGFFDIDCEEMAKELSIPKVNAFLKKVKRDL